MFIEMWMFFGWVKIGIFFKQPLRCSWPFGAFLADPWTRKVGVLKLRSGSLKHGNPKSSVVLTMFFLGGSVGVDMYNTPPYPTPPPPPAKKEIQTSI